MATNGGAATIDGPDPDTLSQPAPGSGAPQPAHDGREYWRHRALRAEKMWAILEKLLAERAEQITAAQVGGST